MGTNNRPHDKCRLFSALVLVVEQRSSGQADPLLIRIYLSDAAVNNITDSKYISHIVNSLISYLRNVDKTVNAVNDLCESTE